MIQQRLKVFTTNDDFNMAINLYDHLLAPTDKQLPCVCVLRLVWQKLNNKVLFASAANKQTNKSAINERNRRKMSVTIMIYSFIEYEIITVKCSIP